MMKDVRDAGHFVVASDEEALPLVNSLKNFAQAALENCNVFLTDTAAHQAILAEAFPNCSEKLIVTGSPRLQSIRSAPVEAIKGTPYIPVNTSLALVNSVWGDVNTAMSKYVLGSSDDEEGARLLLDAECAAREIIVSLIHLLSPQHRVVIRPHPAERAQTWRDAFPDVEVVESSSPTPWIKGAKVLIHANSTTGLEAAIMGVPAINLDPIPMYGERLILNQVNYTARSAQEAADILKSHVIDGAGLTPNALDASLFPPQGAKETAEIITKHLRGAASISGDFKWGALERTEEEKAKFSMPLEQFKIGLDRASSITGSVKCDVHPLGDSVVLLVPT